MFIQLQPIQITETQILDFLKIIFLQGRVKSRSNLLGIFTKLRVREEYAVAQLVEALRHKPKGRGFDSRWSHWNFLVT
jgi:hypothetical protein